MIRPPWRCRVLGHRWERRSRRATCARCGADQIATWLQELRR